MDLAIRQKLLDGASNVDDVAVTPPAFAGSGCIDTTHTIIWSQGTGAGTVEIETASDAAAEGTWAPVSTVSYDGTSELPHTDYVRVQGSYAAFRHRISGIVEGGTVTTMIMGAS